MNPNLPQATSFYSYLRAETLRLQLFSEPDKFIDLALVVCETRAAWQRKQSVELSQIGTGAETLRLTGESKGATLRFLGLV
jgi:hypothetical protein